MALRHCAECAKRISTRALRCPGCGWLTPLGHVNTLAGAHMVVFIVLLFLV